MKIIKFHTAEAVSAASFLFVPLSIPNKKNSLGSPRRAEAAVAYSKNNQRKTSRMAHSCRRFGRRFSRSSSGLRLML